MMTDNTDCRNTMKHSGMKHSGMKHIGMKHIGTHTRQRQAGFTLIELMVVIAITAILISLAVPSMSRFLAKWQMNSALNAFTGSMRQARSEAIKSSRIVTVCPSSDGDSCANTDEWQGGWMVYLDADNNGSYNSGVDDVLAVRSSLSGIEKAQSSGSVKSFSYLPNGLLKSKNSTITFESTNSQQSDRTMTVNRIGRIRLAKN